MDTLYYWDSDKEQGFIDPVLEMSWGEPLMRVKFKELVDMVSNLEV
jgi:MoaA/NifB/PqqE/SkfB family radical SAM enzyme